jgi:alcohol dehydrogenase
MVITHSKTSLPHQLGYFLTYNHNVPHGFANTVLITEYLRFHRDRKKVNTILQLMRMKDLDELHSVLNNLITFKFDITKEEIADYSRQAFENKARLTIHPYAVELQDIVTIFERSLLK